MPFPRFRSPPTPIFPMSELATEICSGRTLYHLDHIPKMFEAREVDGYVPEVAFQTTSRGFRIRKAVFEPIGKCWANLFYHPGKNETIDCYSWEASLLRKEGIRTIIHEPVSQGGSTRINRRNPHVVDVLSYEKDYLEPWLEIIASTKRRPSEILLVGAHSMGCAVAIPALANGRLKADGFIGVAPMIEAVELPKDGIKGHGYWAGMNLLTNIGLGDQVIGFRSVYKHCTDRGVDNKCTRDLERLNAVWLDSDDARATGNPSWRWGREYYYYTRLMAQFKAGQITTPAVIIKASDEGIVVKKRIDRIAQCFTDASTVEVDGRHSLTIGGPIVDREVADHIVAFGRRMQQTLGKGNCALS